jgi:two-component system LytT family response regulator
MTIRTVIVDDEPLARQRIASLLSGESDFEAVAECGDGRSAIEVIAAQAPDLVFLDVQMPGCSGFDVLEALGLERLRAIVFVTAHDQYAVRAFDAHAVDYLLKPFKRTRFRESLARARARVLAGPDPEERDKLLELVQMARGRSERLVVRTPGRFVFLRTNDVQWVEASANYVRIHTDKEQHQVRGKIGDLERSLPPDRFLRIHRSIVVNVDAIAEIQACGGGEYVVVLRSGKELSLGRSYLENLRPYLDRSP